MTYKRPDVPIRTTRKAQVVMRYVHGTYKQRVKHFTEKNYKPLHRLQLETHITAHLNAMDLWREEVRVRRTVVPRGPCRCSDCMNRMNTFERVAFFRAAHETFQRRWGSHSNSGGTEHGASSVAGICGSDGGAAMGRLRDAGVLVSVEL